MDTQLDIKDNSEIEDEIENDKEIKKAINLIEEEKQKVINNFKKSKTFEIFDMSKYDFKSLSIREKLGREKEVKRNKIIECYMNNTFKKTILTSREEKLILKLKETMPNFSSVIDYILSQLKLNSLNKNKMFFKPILILGNPGIGKTYLVNEIAKILNMKSEFVDYGSLQNNFQIKGNHSSYADSKQGLLTDMYLYNKSINSFLILDEIDKNNDKNNEVDSVLYQLTEEINAKQFKDEFLEINLDLTGLIVVATANDISKLNDAILSRFQVFEVNKLNEEDTKRLAKKIYLDIIKEYEFFNKNLKEEILDKLAKLTPREINSKLVLMVNKSIENYSVSQLKKSKNIIVNYFDNDIKKKSIGF